MSLEARVAGFGDIWSDGLGTSSDGGGLGKSSDDGGLGKSSDGGGLKSAAVKSPSTSERRDSQST